MKLLLNRSMYFTLTIVIITTLKSYCQSSSVLQRYMDANPLIQNNPYFQKAQDELTKAAAIPLGLDLPIVNVLTDLKVRISQWRIEEIKVTRGIEVTTLTIILNSGVNIDTIALPPVTINMSLNAYSRLILDSISNRLADRLANNINIINQDKMTNFAMSELAAFIDPSSRTQEISDKTVFKTKMSAFILHTLEQKLQETAQIGKELISTKFSDDIIVIRVLNEVTKLANEKLEFVKQNINTGLDNVISTASDFQRKASNILASANTGISVSNNESGLGGGFSFTFGEKGIGRNRNGSYKVTGIVNGLFSINSNDTLSSQPFIVGLQISLANKDVFQANIIGAFVLDNMKQGTSNSGNNSGELGAGILLKPTDNLILGVNAVYKFYRKTIVLDNGTSVTRDNQLSLGVTIQQAKSNSPIYLIGFAKNDLNNNSFTPTMQIIYPLALNK